MFTILKWVIYDIVLPTLLLVGGFNPSEKYEFVSWDYDIPKWMDIHKIPWFQSTNQISIDGS